MSVNEKMKELNKLKSDLVDCNRAKSAAKTIGKENLFKSLAGVQADLQWKIKQLKSEIAEMEIGN